MNHKLLRPVEIPCKNLEDGIPSTGAVKTGHFHRWVDRDEQVQDGGIVDMSFLNIKDPKKSFEDYVTPNYVTKKGCFALIEDENGNMSYYLPSEFRFTDR